MNEVTQQQVGENLLFPLFRSLSDDYKRKYVRDVWDQFENNIRASAYTAKLSIFLENITKSMPIILQQKFTLEVIDIINSGADKAVLTWLRDETTYLMLIARMKNEERKKEYDLFNQKTEDK